MNSRLSLKGWDMQPITPYKSVLDPLAVSVDGACSALNCGKDVVYQLINSGEIDSFILGRAHRITVESVRNYIARRVSENAPAAMPSERISMPQIQLNHTTRGRGRPRLRTSTPTALPGAEDRRLDTL